MIQIPGIKYGVPDVVTLATLNAAIEDVLDDLNGANISNLDGQGQFLAQCLEAWFEATGRREDVSGSDGLDPDNVVYQGRAVVSFLTLIPACILHLRKTETKVISDDALDGLTDWLRGVMKRAGLVKHGKFLSKAEFRKGGFLGSGGLARFRDTLWVAAGSSRSIGTLGREGRAKRAAEHRENVRRELAALK